MTEALADRSTEEQAVRRVHWAWATLLAVVSGVALYFAYPRWNQTYLVWLFLLPLLVALWTERLGGGFASRKPKRRAFWLGYLAGAVFFIPNLAWVRHSSRVIGGAEDHAWMGWGVELMGFGAAIGLGGFLALYWGLWAVVAVTVGRPRIGALPITGVVDRSTLFSFSVESLRSAFLCAAAWVAQEWLRGIVFTGFPWNGLAVPMQAIIANVQSADLVGANGLSFLPIFVACIGFNTVLRFRQEIRTSRVRPHLDFFCAVTLVILNFGYGVLTMAKKPGETVALKTLLIQLNVPQQEKWNPEFARDIYEGYAQLTELGLKATSPDLVIWPESALPLDFNERQHIPFIDNVLLMADYSLMTGTDNMVPNDATYTGAALLRGAYENHQLYYKVCLVPFGEYLPMRWLPGMEALLGSVLPGDFKPGSSTEPLMLEKPEGVGLIPLICFEDTFGRFARKFARPSPQLIVNCTNDGWFLFSEENEQHLANAVFRCIELRRPMARACNTGVTCFIDTFGRIAKEDRLVDVKTGSVFVKGFLPKDVLLEKNPPMTFYARFGDVFSIAMLIIAGLAFVLHQRGKRNAA